MKILLLHILAAIRHFFKPRYVEAVPNTNDEVHSLIDSINESAKQTSALILTFVATVIYIAIAVASTTDRQLLLDTPLTLPLFNVGVSIHSFYRVAPFIIIVLHLNLLLQEYFVAYRVYRLPLNHIRTNDKEADRFFLIPSVIMRLTHQHHPFIVLLLRMMFMTITVALPAVVLVWIQLKFLPYHDESISRLHREVVLVDLLIVWAFFWFRPRPVGGKSARRRIAMRIEVPLYLLATTMLLAVAFRVAVIPQDWQTCKPYRFENLLGHRNLSLRNGVFTLQEPAAEMVAAQGEHGWVPEATWKMFSRGVSLSRRNLLCADFSGSTLINADFRGADLRGAKFVGASLQGVNFAPLSATDLRLPKSSLEDAPEVVHLYPEEKLEPTRLNGTDFTGANLREANLRFSELTGAYLENADLRSADLSFANLEAARLVGARLFAADMKSTSLRGATLQGAQLQGANMKLAVAEFSSFAGAILDGAELTGARMEGSDFTNASFQGTTGLSLQGVDLHQANVAHASFCGGGNRLAYVDLRDIEITSIDQSGLGFDELRKGLSENPSIVVKNRLLQRTEAKTCLVERPPAPSDHIFYLRQQEEDLRQSGSRPEPWPEAREDESSFYEALASYLVKTACARDQHVQLALAQKVKERLTIDPHDLGARTLARHLVRELLDPRCVPPLDLPEDVKNSLMRWVYLP